MASPARCIAFRSLLAVVVMGTAMGSALAQDTTQAIGMASAVLNEVKLSNAQIAQPRQVALRQRLALADLIQTGHKSQLQMLLLDRSTFSIGADARLRIDRFVYDPSAGRNMAASVGKGAFRFLSGRPNPMAGSTITSPVATIGIRGTIVEGVVGPDAVAIASADYGPARDAKADRDVATLVVLRGPGKATEAGLQPGAVTVSADGASVDIEAPMLAVYVPRAGAQPIGPFRISPKGLMHLRDLIFPALAAPKSSGLLKALPIGLGIGLGLFGGGGGDGQRDAPAPRTNRQAQ